MKPCNIVDTLSVPLTPPLRFRHLKTKVNTIPTHG